MPPCSSSTCSRERFRRDSRSRTPRRTTSSSSMGGRCSSISARSRPYRQGEPWIGYRQFTRQFLFPLMLRAWVGVPFQPWLRGDLEGPTPDQMSKLLAGRKRFNTSALLHVRLQARMESRMADRAVRQELSEAGFSADLILANVRKLRSLVESLDGGTRARRDGRPTSSAATSPVTGRRRANSSIRR